MAKGTLAIVTRLFLLASLSLQVGAVIVDSAGEKVLGEGWNKMPEGCEFEWNRCDVQFITYLKNKISLR